jgi:hypothetical protein
MIRTLNSKKYPANTKDKWWYNLSSPDRWIRQDTQIKLNLYDETNSRKIGIIKLQLDKNDWYRRIMNASRHEYKGINIIKVHVEKEQRSAQYYIYFGKKEEGYYPVNIQENKNED